MECLVSALRKLGPDVFADQGGGVASQYCPGTRIGKGVAPAGVERDERIGNIAAGALLGFFLEEIGPSVYNQAVAQVQERLMQRIGELDIEVHEDEFGYWRKIDAAARAGGKGRGR